MCLAVPMKVIQIKGDMAVVESSGLRREVGIMLLDKVKLERLGAHPRRVRHLQADQEAGPRNPGHLRAGEVLWLKQPR